MITNAVSPVATGRINLWLEVMATLAPAEKAKAGLMRLTLECLVPLIIEELVRQGGPTESDIDFCERFGSRIGSQADRLQFREPKGILCGEGKDRYFAWPTHKLMAQMIHAVAIMAFFPGGITVLGLHFDAHPPRPAVSGFLVRSQRTKKRRRL